MTTSAVAGIVATDSNAAASAVIEEYFPFSFIFWFGWLFWFTQKPI